MDKRREDLASGASLLFMCETHRWRSVKNERLPAQLSKKRMFHDRVAYGEFETWSICSFSITETGV